MLTKAVGVDESLIKFRAWDKDMSRMRTVIDLTWRKRNGLVVGVQDSNQVRVELFPGEYELMRFTGLRDSKGREVYEGDILRWTRKGWRCQGHPENGKDVVDIAVIDWHETYCAFRASRRDVKSPHRVYASGDIDFSDNRAKSTLLEVIGNVHEDSVSLGKEARRDRTL